MQREQMADKTGTGDMAMTVQRAAKGNLKRKNGNYITETEGNRVIDGRAITHIVKKQRNGRE